MFLTFVLFLLSTIEYILFTLFHLTMQLFFFTTPSFILFAYYFDFIPNINYKAFSHYFCHFSARWSLEMRSLVLINFKLISVLCCIWCYYFAVVYFLPWAMLKTKSTWIKCSQRKSPNKTERDIESTGKQIATQKHKISENGRQHVVSRIL
jgi:hypothetical protein